LAVSVIAMFVPAGMMWLLLHADEVSERVLEFGRWCRLVRQPAPVLTHDPPIERIAADLRRLSTAIGQLPDGAPAIRRRGLQTAYDTKLIAGCRALGVPHVLDELREGGVDRAAERMRIEAALEEAGLRFRSAMS
jgi:hypothetical protein